MSRIRFALCIPFLAGTACIPKVKHVSNPPREMTELTPAETPQEREKQYLQHQFVAAEETTTVTTTSEHGTDVSQTQDLTSLLQDGSYYELEDYLPALHAAGIALGTTNPLEYYDDINKSSRWSRTAAAALVLGPVIGVVMRADCGESPSDLGSDGEKQIDVYNDCQTGRSLPVLYGTLGGVAVAGGLGFLGIPRFMKATEPRREAKTQAEKNRAAWAQEWNRQLEEKLAVEEQPVESEPPPSE